MLKIFINGIMKLKQFIFYTQKTRILFCSHGSIWAHYSIDETLFENKSILCFNLRVDGALIILNGFGCQSIIIKCTSTKMKQFLDNQGKLRR